MGIVADEIAFSLENLGTEPGATVARVREAAELCGVKDLLSEKLTELSSGQKQRVALAAASRAARGSSCWTNPRPTSMRQARRRSSGSWRA